MNEWDERDEELTFAEEGSEVGVVALRPWRVLVVDDDEDVHEATALALRGLQILERPLELLHARSAAEALACLRREDDIAVILLDVVMETLTAGLDIIATIRGELGLGNARIVLRSGQPGYAPEIETIRRYDINDYKAKSELTRNKLFTVLSSACRTYDQLCRGDASRHGLEFIVAASRQLMSEREMQRYAAGALEQLASFLSVPNDGFLCVGEKGSPEFAAQFVLLAATGRHAGACGETLATVAPELLPRIANSLEKQQSQIGTDGVVLYLCGAEGRGGVAFLYADHPHVLDIKQLEVFCANIALGGDNVVIFERLRKAAYTDALTGLVNRTALIDEIDHRLSQDGGAGQTLALIDIDQFSAFNDLFGHRYGDQLLKGVARRIEETFGKAMQCVVARVSNDTFAVLGPDSLVVPPALQSVFALPFAFGEGDQSLSVSLGLLKLPDTSGSGGADCLKDAWIGIRRAKALGQGQHVWYSQAIGVETRERTRLLNALRQSFGGERLYVVYQPQLSLTDERVIGVEALMRWRAEDGTFISPASFVPIAESSGLIVGLGEWVLRQALAALGELRELGYLDLMMAVNVSATQFRRPDFIEVIEAALADTGMPADRLELEVTESVAIIGAELVEQYLHALKQRGISVAIDDFGTGFSSLSYLDRLPADRIKIDRAFVSALDNGDPGARGARIAEMVVPLGRRLGMAVLAEGVETEAQAVRLRELGCDDVQGYLYARPMTLADLKDWLAARGSR